MNETLTTALQTFRNSKSSKEEKHHALATIVDLLAQEKAEHPEKYEQSLVILYDLLQEIHLALQK